MEQSSLTSLTYKGSIPEAITEAKRQRKLFVVYISGKNDESSRLENSTWTDLRMADSVAKYCVLFHIPEESTDAANFSAIYPQKSVPCITAIGYNGVQLWQNEGFVSAEDLMSSLEEAWLGLHIQETTATVLSAALASNKSEPSAPGVPKTVSTDEESSSSRVAVSDPGSSSSTVRSPLIDRNVHLQGVNFIGADSDVKQRKGQDCTVESNSPTKSGQGVPSVAMEDLNNSAGDNISSVAESGYSGPEKTTVNHPGVSGEGSQASKNEKNKAVQVEKDEVEDDKKADAFENCTRANKSSDAHLNIRLPNGVSLKQMFSVTSTMRMVKDYVDENQASSLGNYDLAVPYPRKVFSDGDLSKSLSDLGLFDRQALIVVPHHQGTSYLSGRPTDSAQTDSRNIVTSYGSNEGYFLYVKRFLSYFNPLSYFGGGASSSSSGHQSQGGMWEYSPNPAVRNNFTQSSSSSDTNEGKKRSRPPASGFGSNIHTLKHDEDDERFSDRNSFWNGNSTQYGGNDDGK